ncbi:MAG: bifunctional phosphoglucose/phosphomannose isomerase [Desulfurococcaceae archaeon]
MLSAYLEWPSQIRHAVSKWDLVKVTGEYRDIAVFGMGGSGIVGDYLQVLSSQVGRCPVTVVKSHLVPSFIDKYTLSIVVSYSGNTLETLLAFKSILEKRVPVVAVSSGGLLKELSQRYGVLHVDVPSGLVPRASLPSMLFSVLGVLSHSNCSLITKKEAENCAEFLEENLPEIERKAREISDWLFEKAIAEKRLIVLATHSPLEALAVRFKNELNENSKVITKVDVAPEWMHNDIVGYEEPNISNYAVLEIVDPDDSVGAKLVEFMEGVYKEHDAIFRSVELKGGNALEKLLYGSLVAGLTSVHLAEKRGIDPMVTRSIAMYKNKVREIFPVTPWLNFKAT